MTFIFFKKSTAKTSSAQSVRASTSNASVKDASDIDGEYVMINGTKTLKNQQNEDDVKKLKEQIALLQKELEAKDSEVTRLKEALKTSSSAVARLQQHCAEMIARA